MEQPSVQELINQASVSLLSFITTDDLAKVDIILKGFPVDHAITLYGSTLLMEVAANGSINMLQLVLSYGPNLNA